MTCANAAPHAAAPPFQRAVGSPGAEAAGIEFKGAGLPGLLAGLFPGQ